MENFSVLTRVVAPIINSPVANKRTCSMSFVQKLIGDVVPVEKISPAVKVLSVLIPPDKATFDPEVVNNVEKALVDNDPPVFITKLNADDAAVPEVELLTLKLVLAF